MRTLRSTARTALVVIALAAAPRSAATSAPTFTVNDLGDAHDDNPGDGKCESAPGHCTLRAAIEEINALDLPSPSVGVPAGTITLTFGTLSLFKPASILGAGRTATFIDGANASRLLTVVGAVYVEIHDLTLENGSAGAHLGGAIESDTTEVATEDVNFVHCSAAGGGAIHGTGFLYLTRCRLTDCHATSGAGGAILYEPGVPASVSLDSCELDGNDAVTQGGALYVAATQASGIRNTTLSGNSAGAAGGAVYAEGYFEMTYATITNNASGIVSGGGGIWIAAGAQVTADSSIIAGNFERSPQDLQIAGDCTGPLTSIGTNLLGAFGASHCQITGTHVLADPMLGPLGDNGGSTLTHAVPLDSPAFGAGACGPIETDQRGVKRTTADGCELGAFERTPCGDANLDALVDVSDVFALINALFAGAPAPHGFMDANSDGKVDVADVFFLINFLFAGGPTPLCLGS